MGEMEPVSTRKAYQARIYDKYASEFQRSSQQFDHVLADRFAPTFDHYFRGWLPEGKEAVIADLACGGGIFLHFLKRCGYANIVGVDISPEQVEISRQVTKNVTEESLFSFLETHTASFDLITALNIIEHLPKNDTLKFLYRCHAALNPGGRLILMTPNADTPYGLSVRYSDFTHETMFSPGSLIHLLTVCDFAEIKLREAGPVPWGYSFVSTLRYAAWQVVRQGMKIYNFIETGSPGSGVFTRVFTASAIKKEGDEHGKAQLNR
jgi:2-polyprenyl-3-methyl-5-hydroxy-6-metoxy-1,4-benzoquinol methylase